MRKTKPLPTREFLLAHLRYDPATGFIFRISGELAECKSGSHLQVSICGETYGAHRVIWRMVTGDDPGSIEIDHEDTDGINNKWANLRLATSAQNNQNRSLSRRNKCGVKGVCWETSRGKWRASLATDGLYVFLGRFALLEEAIKAVDAERRRSHGEFARAA